MSTPLDPCPLPPLGQDFLLYEFDDGSSLVIKNPGDGVKLSFKHACKFVCFRYSELEALVRGRVEDYAFYFGQLVMTNPNNSVAYGAALDQVMDVFSQNLTSYQVANNGVPTPALTTWGQVKTQQNIFATQIFAGFTSHNIISTRVRPVLNNKTTQASSEMHLIEYSSVNTNDPNKPLYIIAVSFYNFTWAYESGTWRIITWYIDNRIIKTFNPDVLAPKPYVPARDVC